MLVLSRKIHESTLIGETIRVTILEIRGDQVKLGIEAPDDIPIFREEIIKAALRKRDSSDEGANSDSYDSVSKRDSRKQE